MATTGTTATETSYNNALIAKTIAIMACAAILTNDDPKNQLAFLATPPFVMFGVACLLASVFVDVSLFIIVAVCELLVAIHMGYIEITFSIVGREERFVDGAGKGKKKKCNAPATVPTPAVTAHVERTLPLSIVPDTKYAGSTGHANSDAGDDIGEYSSSEEGDMDDSDGDHHDRHQDDTSSSDDDSELLDYDESLAKLDEVKDLSECNAMLKDGIEGFEGCGAGHTPFDPNEVPPHIALRRVVEADRKTST